MTLAAENPVGFNVIVQLLVWMISDASKELVNYIMLRLLEASAEDKPAHLAESHIVSVNAFIIKQFETIEVALISLLSIIVLGRADLLEVHESLDAILGATFLYEASKNTACMNINNR